MKYPDEIMEIARGRLDLEEDDTSMDDIIELMTPREVFESVLEYEGIIGYTSTILGWIRDIFDVDLDGEDEVDCKISEKITSSHTVKIPVWVLSKMGITPDTNVEVFYNEHKREVIIKLLEVDNNEQKV